MNSEHGPLIIAEAGVNHNGDVDLAIELIDAAAEAGAHCVKFQSFKASAIASKNAAKANYQTKTTDESESQLSMLQKLEISSKTHKVLIERCQQKNIRFLSSAFDLGSLSLLSEELKLDTLKLGSGELTNAPMLLAAARSGMKLLLSTGMGSLSEVEEALGVIAFGILNENEPSKRKDFADALLNPEVWKVMQLRVTLLQCTSEYPSAFEDSNLRVMATLRSAFGLEVGFSDHTVGNAMSIAAAALGASVIEKHFTLDKTMSGPDHAASTEPREFADLVRDIRAVSAGLGNGIKQPCKAELDNRSAVRKRVVAVHDLNAGQRISENDITVKRANGGVSAMDYWDCLGRTLVRPIQADSPITQEDMSWTNDP